MHSQTLMVIAIGWANKSKIIQFYNTYTMIIYTTGDYNMDQGRHTNTRFSLTYDGDIFVGTYRLYSNPAPEPYFQEHRSNTSHQTKIL